MNAFLTPAVGAWQKELGTPLEFSGAQIVSNPYTTSDVTALIGVAGALKGVVFYEFEMPAALTVASRMIGEQVEKLDDMGLSALGEVANMITGNATTTLSEANYWCDIGPPVMLAQGIPEATVPTPQILASFTSALGSLSIPIALTEVAD